MEKIQRLKNHRCYLAGPIDAAPDLGEGWRKIIGPILRNKYGLKVFDPLTKPIKNNKETVQIVKERHALKKNGMFDEVAQAMKEIRGQDLRATDGADFGVVYMTRDIPHYGTMEEVVTMNRSKKPILIMFEQGKEQVYDWLLGMFPHEYIFNSWKSLLAYIDNVHSNPDFVDPHNRWVFWEEEEKERLKDELLDEIRNLLCEWEKFDGELILNDSSWTDENIIIPDSMAESYTEFSWVRRGILDKFKKMKGL